MALAVTASVQQLPAQQLPLEPFHQAGQGVTGAFEGWYPNPDGTYTLLFGYFNRNFKEALERIPPTWVLS